MNCNNAREYLDDYFDGMLDKDSKDEVLHHIIGCVSCHSVFENEKQLREMLHSLPAPVPSTDFKNKVVRRAISEAQSIGRFRAALSFGGGLAAAIALWVLVSLSGNILPGGEKQNSDILADMTLEVQRQTTIKMVFNAPHDMLHSQVTLQVPLNLEIVGFPGQREISWNTDLLKGKNLLEVPVVAKKAGQADLITFIDYQNKKKKLTLTTQIQETIQKSSLVLPQSA
ncbi:MAG: zf-HC2 domain-containing protein [Desulfobulbaceae bacterium]|nr:zf-HC2 domain-containing protein [Desulfobulbaceae bacterium]